MARPEIVSIVLAAGKGERIGGPKALLAWPSGAPDRAALPLAIAHAEARLQAESDRVLVVTRRPMMTLLVAYVRPGIDLLASDAPDELGPAGSLAFAVGKSDLAQIEAAVVIPVDVPPPRAATVAAILEALRVGAGEGIIAGRARYQHRGGHPVVLRPEALERYREPSPPPLRDHLRALGARCRDVDVDDPAALVDLNTAADVFAILKSPPRFVGGV